MATRTRPGRPTARHARGARRRRRGPPRQRSDLSARVLAALPAIAVAIVLVVAGGAVFALGLFVLGCICMHELYAMYDRTHPVRLAGFVSLAGLLAAALYGSPPQVLLAAVCALPVLFAFTLMQRRPSVAGLAVTLLGIYWIGLAFAHAVMLRELDHGAGMVVDVLVGTFLGDTGAYLGGRMFGRRPLAPAISPGKTVEGLVTGMICAVLGVWIASRYQEWLPTSHALVLGVGVALVAPVGDLFESFVKREAQAANASALSLSLARPLGGPDRLVFPAIGGASIRAGGV